VIDAFFPYKDLMDRPWADALPEFLADMERVQDAEGYSRTLARMAARLQDNHVAIEGTPFLDGLRGQAGPPVLFRMVEKAVLVDRILDAEKAQGLHRWDEVLEVDGEPVAAWMARVEPFVPFANAWTRDRNLVRLLGRGADGTTVRVKVKAPEGSIREVLLSRSERFQRTFPQTLHPGDTVQILPGGVGYADLGRLLPSEVDAFFTKIMGTEALILDMRGYPHGTAWSIAPRLNVRKASVGATFFPTTISAADPESDSSTLYSEAKFPDPDGKPLYKGKVVMLIDATTQSQAEYTGQLIEAACGVTFIGSPSAGSNGDVTNLRLPGGITVSFTGQGVRNADGRQLQRVGLQPRILVRPTIQGLREGRDEVMDRALRFLKEGH
jgi:C-terminal processing protease CtpA/Prc